MGGSPYINRPQYGGSSFNNQGAVATFAARSNSISWHLHVIPSPSTPLSPACDTAVFAQQALPPETQLHHTATDSFPYPTYYPNPALGIFHPESPPVYPSPFLNQTQSATTMTWTAWPMWPETLVCRCPEEAGPSLDLVKFRPEMEHSSHPSATPNPQKYQV